MPKELLDLQETEDGKIHVSPYDLMSPFMRKLREFTSEPITTTEGCISAHERIVIELKSGKKLVFQTGDTGEAWVAGYEKDECAARRYLS